MSEHRDADEDRRKFMSSGCNIAMAGGLACGYGMLPGMAARFLHVEGAGAVGWQFLATVDEMRVGQSLTYVGPTGAKLVVARQSEGDAADNFIALSSVCPHLGCQVHWEPQNDRFFCPCHNGAFDREGNPTEGPVASANQQLTRFPIKVENGLVFVEVPLESVATESAALTSTA